MRPFQVEVGNDAIKLGVGGCENVELIVQGVSIVVNFLVMELGDWRWCLLLGGWQA